MNGSMSSSAGSSAKGTWVRLLHPPIEGRQVSGFDGTDVCHRLRVQLAHTDVERGYIEMTQRPHNSYLRYHR
jgi:hypothetical protein